VEVIDIDSNDNNPNYNTNKLWGYCPQYTRPRLKYIKADMVNYNYNKKYDKIYCIGVLEHMSINDAELMRKKIPELLNDNGIAVITWDVAKDMNREDRLDYHCDVLSEVYYKEV
jgi:predicted SAM-dependent methyltransferase